MKQLTVKQLAVVSGVTVRTLHHYDEIGLLKPACVGANGYRYYGQDQMLRLQRILFHREFGVPLEQIGALLDREGADQVVVLQEHRKRLAAHRDRLSELLQSIDQTIAHLKGECVMSNADLYRGFSAGKQASYEAWLVEQYGPQMREAIAHSSAQWSAMDEAGRAAAMQELAQVEHALAEACRREVDPGSDAVDLLLQRHRAWVAMMWGKPCPPQAYAGLADLYLSHPDFVARHERLAPGFAQYLAGAMKRHAAATDRKD